MNLNELWFLLLGVLLAGYAILDGFDLGTGILHLFARKDEHRRAFLNAIAPFWDGNEVWLITFGGALFAAFPHAYATVFSAFYAAFMLLLFALVFRAVSIEFRSKKQSAIWRQLWDVAFSASSTLAAFLFGMAVGNLMRGLPIGPDMEFRGGFTALLHPYTVLVGLFSVTLFALHGALYLSMKTDAPLHTQLKGMARQIFWIFTVLYVSTTIYTLWESPLALRSFRARPWGWLIVTATIAAVVSTWVAMRRNRLTTAFVSSCVVIACLVFLLGFTLFPELVPSRLSDGVSLDIYNAASSQKTLAIMAVIAAPGMPLVIAYTIVVYRVFRGKTQLGKFAY